MRYYATFASGFGEVVEEILQKELPLGKTLRMLDGAVLFESEQLVDLHFANNIFAVLDELKGNLNLDKYIKTLLLKNINLGPRVEQQKTFRIVTSDKNQLVSVNNVLKSQLEQKIASITGFKLDRTGADVEFWLLRRSEGMLFFMMRLTKHKDFAKTSKKGELHPQIAYMMNFLSEPRRNELYLDPFCGSGALPLSRIKHFGNAKVYAKVYANDILPMVPIDAKDFFFSNNDYFKYDFGGLVFDKIVTDPPWGKYDGNVNPNTFYKRFFAKAASLLREGGIVVVLVAREINVPKFAKGFKVVQKLDVLISGPKASVYKLLRCKSKLYNAVVEKVNR